MKKIFIVLFISCLLLVGCDISEDENTITSVQIEYSDFNLVVDQKTGIVYIDNYFDYEGGYPGHVYTPYYSKNGKLCRFVDGMMQEVKDADCD